MCGIFGFTMRQSVPVKQETMRELLRELISLSESRGKEAAGIAITNNDELAFCKAKQRGTEFCTSHAYQKLTQRMITTEAIVQSPICCIGHTRLVTNGTMERAENNQPIVRNNILAIHNGIIVNDFTIFKEHKLQRTCDLDTEALLALMEQGQAKNLTPAAAFSRAMQEVEGTASVALLFKDYPHLILATNNGSLYILIFDHGMIFTSERFILERIIRKFSRKLQVCESNITHLKPQQGLQVSLTNGDIKSFSLLGDAQIKTTEPHKAKQLINTSPSLRTVSNANTQNMLSQEEEREFTKLHNENQSTIDTIRRCTHCILPETMPFITFNEGGLCSFCQHHTPFKKKEASLEQSVERYLTTDDAPNCLFPLSGGRDSSYGLHYVKNVLKLNPIAYSYDWGMLTDLGRRNQARMCGKLGVEHIYISADIERKRRFIAQNVSAWLKKPDLGTVPLFMAGDKQYFYHLNRLKKQVRTNLTVYCENPLEQTNFKHGFCGVAPKFDQKHVYKIGIYKKIKLALYYARHYAQNPSLLNASLTDTASAFLSTYFIPHDYLYLFQYMPWEEEVINKTLIEDYNWELAPDTTTTWRIGDGTAPFYNYIYFTVAGFTENDTFRSNQIREGLMTREHALELVKIENKPRFESLMWYGNTIGIDIIAAMKRINAIPKLYSDGISHT